MPTGTPKTAKTQLNLTTVSVLMVALGIDSTAEMARRTGMDRTYLSRVLRGLRPAQPSQVIAIARALRVPPIAIIGPSDPTEVTDFLAGQDAA